MSLTRLANVGRSVNDLMRKFRSKLFGILAAGTAAIIALWTSIAGAADAPGIGANDGPTGTSKRAYVAAQMGHSAKERAENEAFAN